ncbi:MAG: DUF4296 domain-containing protein [bacterium]|jgi:hypothetical protein
MIRFITIVICIGFFSCSSEGKKPNEIIEKEKMTEVIRDITLAETYVDFYLKKDTTISKDTLLKREIEKVLTLHKIDVPTFSSSYTYYKNHPEQFKIIVDSASAWFTKDKTSLFQKSN